MTPSFLKETRVSARSHREREALTVEQRQDYSVAAGTSEEKTVKKASTINKRYTRAQVKAALETRMLERTFLGAGSAVKKLLSGGHLVGSTVLLTDVYRARDHLESQIRQQAEEPVLSRRRAECREGNKDSFSRPDRPHRLRRQQHALLDMYRTIFASEGECHFDRLVIYYCTMVVMPQDQAEKEKINQNKEQV